MTLAYSSELVAVHEGRAEDVLPTLARRSVDLIATDPPYGQGWQSNNRRESATFALIEGDDGALDVTHILGLALGVLRSHRHVYVFGPLAIDGLPLTEPAELIWDKVSASQGDMTRAWGKSHERVTFTTFSPSKANRARGDGRLAARLRRGSVIRVPRLNSRGVKRHPTEKPVALMRQLIESSSLPGETVLDPFAGSGSTLVAAVLSGRRAVGIELDAGHVQTTIERVRAAEKLALAMGGI